MRKALILLVAFLVSVSPATLCGGIIPPTDTNFLNSLTYNNWATNSDSVNSAVCGASFTLGFTATQQVALGVDNAHLSGLNASRYPIIAWTVNGGPLQTHQLLAGETSVLLASGVTNPIIDFYIRGMSPLDDRYNGDTPLNSVKITGFTVDDGGGIFSVVLPKKLWLNIGDSIMSGDEALYAAGQGRPADDLWAASEDGRASYGYLLAQHYGYREARLAYGGYDWGGGLASVPALATLIDQKTSTKSRLTSGLLFPMPDVVLINLGENGAPSLASVTNALFKLRSRITPATKVIVMIPVSGVASTQVTQGFNSYTNSSLDTNAFLVNLGAISYATGDGQHPTAQGHLSIYKTALPYLDPIIAPAPLRICPMGDSVTAGYTDNPNWTVPFQFGYRSGLYSRLTNSNVSFQFVGSSPEPWNGASGTVTNTPNPDLRTVNQGYHEGYGGQGAAFVLSHIGQWLTNDQPDVVLLQIGINDIGQGSTGEPTTAEANLSNIVAMAAGISPNTRIIVAQITPYSSDTAALLKYNNYIANVLVPYFAAQGKLVSTVNQFTNLCQPGTTNIDASLFANGINHPNAVAYDHMAQTWFAGLQQYYFTLSPPTVAVDTEPATASAFIGEPITFRASFSSDQSMSYQWWKITGGVTNVIGGATSSSLSLGNLQSTDAAAYFLVASNSLGVASSLAGTLTVSSNPAPVGNLITAYAAETGRGVGTFTPGWAVVTNQSLIAGMLPSTTSGNFSLEASGRSVNILTAGDAGALTKITGPSGYTSSTNYVTCGNGGGAGAAIIYTLSGATNGYDVTNITVYGGWADSGRDQQAYTVSYSSVASPSTFVPLAVVNNNPSIGGGIQSATRVSLRSATGALATNVAAVKFDFTSPASENGYCGYNQITIFGAASATALATNAPSVISIPQFATSSSAFDGALKVNLIRAGQPSLSSVSASHGPSIPAAFTTGGLNDGSAAANANYTYYAISESVGNLPVTITFNLNTNSATGGSAIGYNVKNVQAITGWSDSNLANQQFQLLFSIGGGPYQDYGTFNATTNTTTLNNGNNAILQTLTNTSSGTIASRVTGIQFVFANPGGTQGGSKGTLIRELQVLGSPTVASLSMQTVPGNNPQLIWPQGLLLEASQIPGPWVTNTIAQSPFTVVPAEPAKFFRVLVP